MNSELFDWLKKKREKKLHFFLANEISVHCVLSNEADLAESSSSSSSSLSSILIYMYQGLDVFTDKAS